MDIASEITRLKEKNNAIILAHNYQRPEIQDIADFVGDSLGLSRRAAETVNETIVFCGVSFMAETAKILSPQKKVLLPGNKNTLKCPMASMVSVEQLRKLKKKFPGAAVVSYVNTTASIKAESDICCTSSNAVDVVESLDRDRIIFVPDKNLSSYVSRFTEKEIIPWDGYCYVHNRISVKEAIEAKKKNPDALLFVHPECKPELIEEADEVLSTGGMVRTSKESTCRKFLIGTEEGLIHRLKKENPQKEFYASGIPRICKSMKSIHLEDVHQSLKYEHYSIELLPEIIEKAKESLESMLEYY